MGAHTYTAHQVAAEAARRVINKQGGAALIDVMVYDQEIEEFVGRDFYFSLPASTWTGIEFQALMDAGYKYAKDSVRKWFKPGSQEAAGLVAAESIPLLEAPK